MPMTMITKKDREQYKKDFRTEVTEMVSDRGVRRCKTEEEFDDIVKKYKEIDTMWYIKSVEQVKEKYKIIAYIKKEIPFVNIKEYSHNLISMQLGYLEEVAGREAVVEIVNSTELKNLGWGFITSIDSEGENINCKKCVMCDVKLNEDEESVYSCKKCYNKYPFWIISEKKNTNMVL